MNTSRAWSLALFIIAFGWLGLWGLFFVSGVYAGKTDVPAMILGVGLFGVVPALILGGIGGYLRARGTQEAQQMVQIDLQQQILGAVETRGHVDLGRLAFELGTDEQQIRRAVYDLVNKRLFTGYVNWNQRELYSAQAADLPEGQCPHCGGRLELAGKGAVVCPYCGTETFLDTQH